jgi:hypothetical protein
MAIPGSLSACPEPILIAQLDVAECHATQWHSLINPPSTCLRWIRAVRSVT